MCLYTNKEVIEFRKNNDIYKKLEQNRNEVITFASSYGSITMGGETFTRYTVRGRGAKLERAILECK